MFRQWANLGSMAAMMALPWGFASFSDTPITYVIFWDVLLGLHIISLLVLVLIIFFIRIRGGGPKSLGEIDERML